MAKKPKNAAASNATTAATPNLLASIVAATASEAGFMYVNGNDAEVTALVAAGDIETNANMADGNGNIAARATEQGKSKMETNTNPATTGGASGASQAEQPKFNIVMRKPSAPERKRPNRSAMYPFDDMPAPDAEGNRASFFIPATADRPKPWATMASTVSAASRRHSRVVGTETYNKKDGSQGTRNKLEFDRKFRVYEGVDENGNKGAWVERTK